MDPLLKIWEAISTGSLSEVRLGLTLGVILFLWLAWWAIARWAESGAEDTATLYRWRRLSLRVAVVLGLFAVATIWFQEFRSLATFFGLLTAGLAIALRDLVTSLAGWFFILLRKPFEVGDRVQIGDHSGDVIDQRLFKFTLMEIGHWVDADQSTGRVVHLPNSAVLTESIVNYTSDFEYIWNEIPVLVTFESHWRDAKVILQEIADRHAGDIADEAQAALRKAARRFLLFYKRLTPTVYTSVQDSGVLLTIRHLCRPRRRRGVSQAIWEDILERFGERADIDFAYPTQRFFDHRTEGKPASSSASQPPPGD